MAAGYRSYFAFWAGGMSAYVVAAPPPGAHVVGNIVIYPAVGGSPSIYPAVGGDIRLNRPRS